MTRVFFIEEPRGMFDVSTAEQYGTMHVLFPRGDQTKPPIFSTERFSRALVRKLRALGYEPMRDRVCVQGSLCSVGISIAAIVSAFGPIRGLLYDRGQEAYVDKILGDVNEHEHENTGARVVDHGNGPA